MTALTILVQPAARVAHRVRYSTIALSATISVLLLIIVGSIVRVSENGLGCPDWPLCYGQVVPPFVHSAWVEFSHRLLASVTSLHIAALAFWAWKSHRRETWIVVPATLTVGFLVVQIVLGGLHVLLELPPQTGWMHTATAMALAASIAAQLAASHPLAETLRLSANAPLVRDKGLPTALVTTAGLVYLLILSGAYVTRTGASLACPSFPYCGTEAYEAAIPQLVNIQMFHRFTAFGVAITLCLVLWRLARAARGVPELRGAVGGLTALVVVQFGLGISNVLLRLPQWSRTLHLLVAGLLWMGLVMLWVTIRRGMNSRAAAPLRSASTRPS